MAIGIGGQSNTRIALGDIEIGKASIGDVLVYSSGSVVTYHVDTDTVYTEEVDSGASVLTPSSFKPSKSGYTFVGWRGDTTADGDVLSSKTMESEPITLYAVFRKVVTLTYYNSVTTPGTWSQNQYYNNGNYANPTFTLKQADLSGWAKRGWGTSDAANASVVYADGRNVELSSDITVYGLYEKTVTLTAVSYNSTQTVQGTVYHNSAGNEIGASVIAPTGAACSGWTWRGWSGGGYTSANAAVAWANGATINLTCDITIYGLYEKTITETFVDYNGSTGVNTPVKSTAYYNSAGNTVYPNITAPTGGAWNGSGWIFRGWGYPDSGENSVNVAAGQTFASTTNCYRSAIYAKTITLSYNGNGATGGSVAAKTGTMYVNILRSNYSYPTFTLAGNGFSRTNKSFVAWAMGSTGGTQYAAGNTVTLSSNATFYAVWQQVYTPYTIRETGDKQFNSFTWTPYTYSTGGYDYSANAYGVYVEAAKTGGNMAICSYTATLPTQGCNWMRVKYDVDCDSGCGASIMDTQLISTDENGGLVGGYKQNQYAYFNISEDATSISFTIQTTSSAGYDEEGGRGFLNVDEIYFYYE